MGNFLSIQKRIEEGEFKNNLPYPNEAMLENHLDYQKLTKEIVAVEERRYSLASARNQIVQNMQADHCEEDSQIIVRFRAALEKEYDLQTHPKRDKIWSMAWDDGHSGGWDSIHSAYAELVDLVV